MYDFVRYVHIAGYVAAIISPYIVDLVCISYPMRNTTTTLMLSLQF